MTPTCIQGGMKSYSRRTFFFGSQQRPVLGPVSCNSAAMFYFADKRQMGNGSRSKVGAWWGGLAPWSILAYASSPFRPRLRSANPSCMCPDFAKTTGISIPVPETATRFVTGKAASSFQGGRNTCKNLEMKTGIILIAVGTCLRQAGFNATVGPSIWRG
jgi:hypothetical protein